MLDKAVRLGETVEHWILPNFRTNGLLAGMALAYAADDAGIRTAIRNYREGKEYVKIKEGPDKPEEKVTVEVDIRGRKYITLSNKTTRLISEEEEGGQKKYYLATVVTGIISGLHVDKEPIELHPYEFEDTLDTINHGALKFGKDSIWYGFAFAGAGRVFKYAWKYAKGDIALIKAMKAWGIEDKIMRVLSDSGRDLIAKATMQDLRLFRKIMEFVFSPKSADVMYKELKQFGISRDAVGKIAATIEEGWREARRVVGANQDAAGRQAVEALLNQVERGLTGPQMTL